MKGSILLAAGAAAAFTAAGIYSGIAAQKLQLQKYTVSSKALPRSFDGVKILHLSDLHNREITPNNQKLLKLIREASPDFIVMTGDMADRRTKGYENFLELCRGIPAEIPVFYVIGNHELYYEDDELSEMFQKLRKTGVTILNNEKISLSRGSDSISLYGMWYGIHFYKHQHLGYAMHQTFSLEEMHRLLGKKAYGFTLLLTHNPLDFPICAKWGADLTLSGHIHGGCIELPKIGGLLSPERKFLPHYCAGEYFRGNHTMIVSKGLGGVRMIPAEVSLITLKSEK